MQDPEVRAEWSQLAPARAVALRLVGFRIGHDLTRTALGRLVGMSQPAIARLEAAGHVPSLATLVRLADALEIELLVGVTPARKRSWMVTAEAERAEVVERVATARGGRLLIAAG